MFPSSVSLLLICWLSLHITVQQQDLISFVKSRTAFEFSFRESEAAADPSSWVGCVICSLPTLSWSVGTALQYLAGLLLVYGALRGGSHLSGTTFFSPLGSTLAQGYKGADSESLLVLTACLFSSSIHWGFWDRWVSLVWNKFVCSIYTCSRCPSGLHKRLTETDRNCTPPVSCCSPQVHKSLPVTLQWSWCLRFVFPLLRVHIRRIKFSLERSLFAAFFSGNSSLRMEQVGLLLNWSIQMHLGKSSLPLWLFF